MQSIVLRAVKIVRLGRVLAEHCTAGKRQPASAGIRRMFLHRYHTHLMHLLLPVPETPGRQVALRMRIFIIYSRAAFGNTSRQVFAWFPAKQLRT